MSSIDTSLGGSGDITIVEGLLDQGGLLVAGLARHGDSQSVEMAATLLGDGVSLGGVLLQFGATLLR